jgi:uncharacterized membrane-anchored protein YhcB (DUF1043 family)
MKKIWALPIVFVLACSGASATQADLEQELQDIKTQRAQLEDVFSQQLLDCLQKFNVTDCRQGVLSAKAKALSPLKDKQRELQARLRTEKADQRRAKILEKQSAP